MFIADDRMKLQTLMQKVAVLLEQSNEPLKGRLSDACESGDFHSRRPNLLARPRGQMT